MAKQHAQGDRVIRKVRIAQAVAEIVADIGIQRELAIFHQLHHAECGHQL